jgi:RHS repeat-associated protein
VLKTATDAQNAQRHTVYVFPSLELRSTVFNGTAAPNEYQRDATTEVGYLFANGVRLARLVNEPLDSGNTTQGLRVFIELGDYLGSNSIAIDRATSELAERTTYQAYGGAESDYRPDKWGSFREDYGFTGKEEDVEVGLTYFGKRFYNAALQRWVSADPLEVHQGGSGEPNLYSYVSGCALQNIDPLGLAEDDLHSFSADGLPTDEASQSMSMVEPASSSEANQSTSAPTHERAEPQSAPEWGTRDAKDCHGGCQVNGANPEAREFKQVTNVAWVGAGAVCIGATGGASCAAVFGGLLAGEATSSPNAPAESKGSPGATSAWLSALMGTTIKFGAGTPEAASEVSVASDTGEAPAARGASGASSALNGAQLTRHLDQLEKYGQAGLKELESGRIRYYGELHNAAKQGEMAGRRLVREWDPATNEARTWHETLDHAGQIRIARPETGGPKIHFMFDELGNFTGTF